MKQLFLIIRKISLRVLAIVLGVALAVSAMAFANAKKVRSSARERNANDELATFQYKPPSGSNPYAQSKVENPANWVYTTGDECDGGNHLPCQITVSSDYYTIVGSTPTLNTSGSIVTIATLEDGTSGNFYVNNGGAISGRANKSE